MNSRNIRLISVLGAGSNGDAICRAPAYKACLTPRKSSRFGARRERHSLVELGQPTLNRSAVALCIVWCNSRHGLTQFTELNASTPLGLYARQPLFVCDFARVDEKGRHVCDNRNDLFGLPVIRANTQLHGPNSDFSGVEYAALSIARLVKAHWAEFHCSRAMPAVGELACRATARTGAYPTIAATTGARVAPYSQRHN